MRRMQHARRVALIVMLTAGTAAAQGAAQKAQPTKPGAQAPEVEISAGAGPIVVVETEKGTFEFETYPNEAPRTVKHVLTLIQKRFYNGQRFHRVIPGFVIQVGDPKSRDLANKEVWGSGNSGTAIGVSEVSKLRRHVRGAVGIAFADDARNADSQFYVTLSPQPQLDKQYTVFGKVISGMDVVGKIVLGDRVTRVTVKEAK